MANIETVKVTVEGKSPPAVIKSGRRVVVVSGLRAAAVVAALTRESRTVFCEPLPDDEFAIEVRADSGRRLEELVAAVYRECPLVREVAEEWEAPPKVELPPLRDGAHVFPDGSRVRPSAERPGKWVGLWPDGIHLKHEPPEGGRQMISFFDSAEAVALALAMAGFGPAANNRHNEAPRIANV